MFENAEMKTSINISNGKYYYYYLTLFNIRFFFILKGISSNISYSYIVIYLFL